MSKRYSAVRRGKKSGSTTHKRVVLSNSRPPKGRKWIRVSTMLEILKEKHSYHAFGVGIFQFLGILEKKHGGKGCAITEYAWEWYLKHGYSLSEAGLVEHIDGTEFGLWLSRMSGSGWKVESVEKPVTVIDTDAISAKVVGDRIRAENAALDIRQAEYAIEYYRQQDAQNIWRRISKGTFPLGEAVFKTEMNRLATLRAAVATR